MVLSLSPGRTPLDEAENVGAMANMWRISGDFWDDWSKLKEQFDLCNAWSPYIESGHWPDADMLPLGRLSLRGPVDKERTTRFTRDEQYTMMTLWSMFRSPLMIGGNMPQFDDSTLSLLSNNEVLGIDQHSINNHEVYDRDSIIVWRADSSDGTITYVAVFNTRDTVAEQVPVKWNDLGLKSSRYEVRDIWQVTPLGSFRGNISLDIPEHGVRLIELKE